MDYHQLTLRNADPAFAKGWEKFAKKKWQNLDIPKAIAGFKLAVSLDPTLVTAWCNLGILSSPDSNLEQSQRAYEVALALKPDWKIGIQFIQCFRYLLNVYDTPEEVIACHEAFAAALLEFYRTFQEVSLEDIQQIHDWLGFVAMFLLPYQGLPTRHLQKTYGQVVHQVMTTLIPKGKERPAMPPLRANEPLRIGILCGFFRRHTVWKLMLHNWMRQLHQDKFHLYGYYPQSYSDDCTEATKQYCHQFEMGIRSSEEWFERIRSDNLHLLLLPEIGMNLDVIKLASLWLAPIQCVSWGHPDTCGLPTVEYFLSSELMEPANGAQAYCETLVKLKNLGIQFSPLPIEDRPPISRETYGLKTDAVLYGCLQSAFKYLPQFDYIYPEIAAAVGNCQFVFISHKMTPNSRQRFEARLERAFSAKHLNWQDYCFISPPLNFYGFTSMLHCLDIFLDSIEWSGGCTTLEALHYAQLPMVTTPGRFMRGRHTAAILTLLGLPELIAPTVAAYIQKAIELGQNATYRQEIREFIQANLDRVMADTEGIQSLETFIVETVSAYPRK